MTDIEALRERHSVRRYIDRPLEEDKITALRNEISMFNEEGGLRMQLVINERKAFSGILSYGSFKNVSNYVMVVGKKSESLEYRAGYYAERLVLYAQGLGLNTCIVGLTYRKTGGRFTTGKDEKVVICIAIGYGAEHGRNHGIKSPQRVSNISDHTPGWFAKGVKAALLAPTALNQQKFYFEYVAPDTGDKQGGVRPLGGKSLAGFTKVDLGIAMCNFEIGAGKENFHWLDNPME